VEECNFSFLKEKLEFTDGVLSVHLKKLEENKYISVKKSFLNNRPNTDYKITQKGRIKLLEYIANMEDLIKTVKDSL
jgi:DNA-binding HxlR family transcriptional regulator